MKKLISLIAIGFLFAGGISFADYDESGAIRNKKIEHPGLNSDPVKIITLVHYADQGVNIPSISNGDVVIWDINSDDGVTVALATASSDAAAGIAVGIIQTADITADASGSTGRRSWGYAQVYGLHSAAKVDGSSITAGDGLRVAPEGRRATSVRATNYITGNTGGATLGFAFNTSSASTDAASVFIRCQ